MRCIVLAALLVALGPLRAQIVAAEYFFDDPLAPEGSGVAVPVGALGPTGLAIDAIDVSGLSPGFHQLYVRFQEAGGSWSDAIVQPLAVNLAAAPAPQLTLGEAFIGPDPGEGAGTALTGLAPLGIFPVTLSATDDNSSVTVRLSDGDTTESIIQPYFRSATGDDAAPRLVTVEQFVGADPGEGSGTALNTDPITQGRIQGSLPATDVAPDFTLGLRAIDTLGRATTLVQPAIGIIALEQPTQDLSLDRMELFIGPDPGLDNGEPLTLLTSAQTYFGRATVNIADFAMPFDTLSIRARENDGTYSQNLVQGLDQRDTDFDQIVDLIDIFPRDPFEWRDSDGDGIGNNSDPDIDGDGQDNATDTDDDNDGMPDEFEQMAGLDPRDPVDALLDSDNDGLTNADEFLIGTDPRVADTDGDGVLDGSDPTPLTVGVIDPVPTPPSVTTGDRFGASVSIDEAYFVAGAPFEDNGGAAFVYRTDGDEPIVDGELRVPAGFVGAQLGGAVSISGNIAVVGAPGFVPPAKRKGANTEHLQAAIFERVGQGWTFKQALVGNDPSGSDQFGASVAIVGEQVFIGAPRDDDGVVDSGAVYCFEMRGGSFVQVDKLKPEAPTAGKFFGASLAANSDRVAVGAPGSLIDQATRGSVTLYERVAENLRRLNEMSGSNADSGAGFGSTIALEGTTLAVGAPGENGDTGAVYAFDVTADLVESIRLRGSDAAAGDRFGAAVSIDANGLVAGSPNAGGVGAFYAFDAIGGEELARIEALSGQTQFGASIALLRDRIVIGAPSTGQDRGAVAFSRDPRQLFRSDFE